MISSGADTEKASKIFDMLSGVASVVCVVVMVLYAGYNLDATEALHLRGIAHICLLIFTVHIVYQFTFLYRTTVKEAKPIKWIVDAAIILAALIWFFPGVWRLLPASLEAIFTGNFYVFLALTAYSVVQICYSLSRIPGRRTNPSILMASSFLIFIGVGAMVLKLPKCTYHGISYFDSLFLASSAVSITGLSPVDIPSTFTPLGILALSVLIQLGSLGIITFTSFFALFFTGNTSIYNQLLLRDVVYSKSMNALIPTLLYVLGFTVTIETLGAVCVYLTVPDALGLGIKEKVIFSVFHAMSSFCNAGFSCLPGGMSNPVLMRSYQGIYIVTSILIFAGAVGFPILTNFRERIKYSVVKIVRRLTGRKGDPIPLHILDLNTKIVLCTTLSVLVVGSLAFFILEYDNSLRGMSVGEKAVQSVFNSLVPRSAGFASVNPAVFLDATLLLVMVQMVIGGSSQSMGGGIKVNTFGALLLNLRAVVLNHEEATAFGRAISRASIRRANAVVVISAMALTAYTFTLLCLEPQLPAKSVIFESTSALFTVGSSLGITGELSDASKLIISSAMFLGRVGILSIMAGMMKSGRDASEHYPTDNIIIN